MALEYRIDVLAELKAAGYTTDKLRQRGLLSESVIQHLRKQEQISWATLERVCALLDKQPGDILCYNGAPDNSAIAKQQDRKALDRKADEFAEGLYAEYDALPDPKPPRGEFIGNRLKEFYQSKH